MQLSVVLGSYNRRWFLEKTIASVRACRRTFPIEIIVIDGGSSDGTIEWLVRQKDVIAMVQHNRGDWNGRPIERKSWGFFMNIAFRAAHGKFVLMISDDCIVHPDAIVNGVGFFERLLSSGRNVGAVPFFWRDWPMMRDYQVGLTFGGHPFVNHGLYLKSALEQVGFIDEERYFFYHADGDLCLRMIQAGFEIEPCRTSIVEHYSHANAKVRASNTVRQQKDWAAYQERWRNIFFFEGKEEPLRESLGPDEEPKNWDVTRYWGGIGPEGRRIAFNRFKLKVKSLVREFRTGLRN